MASDSGVKRGVTTISENMRSSASAVINGPPAQEGLTHELSILLRNHSRVDAMVKLKDMAVNRSGSAPPVVDGSFATLGNLFSSNVESGSNVASSGTVGIDGEQELRSDPAYLAYYYSHINTNPRLPPPIISQKNYLLAHRLANGAKSTSFDNDENRSLFMSQLLLPNHKEELQSSENGRPLRSDLSRQDNWKEWGPDGASGLLHDFRPKSLVDRIQVHFCFIGSLCGTVSRLLLS
jgi:pumilio RNA-binding family